MREIDHDLLNRDSPVNPDGETRLTREQIWKGLELKARDARLFLPQGLCTHCEVVEENSTHFVREATIAGSNLREIITLEPHFLPRAGSDSSRPQLERPPPRAVVSQVETRRHFAPFVTAGEG